MSLEEVFLHDVLEHPDDDTPRLVYADWLDEHGDERGLARGELIRTQCELERLPPDDPRWADLERQASDLLKAHSKAWLAPLRKAKLGIKNPQFRRGFLEEVTMKAPGFVRSAEHLFHLVPTIRSIYLPDASNEVKALADCPYLSRLTAINLHRMCVCGMCRIQDELRKLFASPHVANLTSLGLSGDRINVETARHLAESPYLVRLTTLDLSNNFLGNAGVRVLAGSQHLGALTTLNLSGNDIGLPGARALAASPLLGQLTTLDLSDNKISSTAAKALANSPHLTDRLRLLLDGNTESRGSSDQ
jgi:uncharacterized protein (TIGR02996 family)